MRTWKNFPKITERFWVHSSHHRNRGFLSSFALYTKEIAPLKHTRGSVARVKLWGIVSIPWTEHTKQSLLILQWHSWCLLMPIIDDHLLDTLPDILLDIWQMISNSNWSRGCFSLHLLLYRLLQYISYQSLLQTQPTMQPFSAQNAHMHCDFQAFRMCTTALE